LKVADLRNIAILGFSPNFSTWHRAAPFERGEMLVLDPA
jgi:hypothetical protein